MSKKKAAVKISTQDGLSALRNVYKDKVVRVPYPYIGLITKTWNFAKGAPDHQAAKDALEKLERTYKVHEQLLQDKALYCSEIDGGIHKYIFKLNLELADAMSAIKSPALVVTYLLGIPGFQAMIPVDHPLAAEFEAAELDPKKHIELIEKHREELEEVTAEMLQKALKGEPLPRGTKILLFADSVRVAEHVIKDNEQYIRLETLPKHTFHPGNSTHHFSLDALNPARIVFTNFGEGDTDVPFFAKLNKFFSLFMWSASARIGIERYKEYIQREHKPETLQEVKAFLLDNEDQFAKHIGQKASPMILNSYRFLEKLGFNMSPINLFLVDYYLHEKHGNLTRMAELKKEAIEYGSSQFANHFRNTFKTPCDYIIQLENSAMVNKFFEYLAGTESDLQPITDLPDEFPVKEADAGKKPSAGLFSSHFVIFGLALAVGTLLLIEDRVLTQAQQEKIESKIGNHIRSVLTDEEILNLQNDYESEARSVINDIDESLRSPSEIQTALSNSIDLELVISNLAESTLDDIEPQLLDSLHDDFTSSDDQADLSKLINIAFGKLSPAFFGEGGLTEAWNANVTDTEFLGPDREELIKKEGKEAAEQKEASIRALEEFQAKHAQAEIDADEQLRKEARDLEEKAARDETRAETAEQREQESKERKPDEERNEKSKQKLNESLGK